MPGNRAITQQDTLVRNVQNTIVELQRRPLPSPCAPEHHLTSPAPSQMPYGVRWAACIMGPRRQITGGGRLLLARSMRAPFVEHIWLEFFVASAIGHHDDVETASFVEPSSIRILLECPQPKPMITAELCVGEQRRADAARLLGWLDIEVVEHVGAKRREAEDSPVLIPHPYLLLLDNRTEEHLIFVRRVQHGQ